MQIRWQISAVRIEPSPPNISGRVKGKGTCEGSWQRDCRTAWRQHKIVYAFCDTDSFSKRCRLRVHEFFHCSIAYFIIHNFFTTFTIYVACFSFLPIVCDDSVPVTLMTSTPFLNSLSILRASWNHIPFSSTLEVSYHSILSLFPLLYRLDLPLVFTSPRHHHFSYSILLPFSSHCLGSGS